jgi:hypothetical protein
MQKTAEQRIFSRRKPPWETENPGNWIDFCLQLWQVGNHNQTAATADAVPAGEMDSVGCCLEPALT